MWMFPLLLSRIKLEDRALVTIVRRRACSKQEFCREPRKCNLVREDLVEVAAALIRRIREAFLRL